MALELADRLRSDGLRVWVADWLLPPEDSVPLATQRGLDASRTLVLLMSEATFASEWARLERDTLLFRDPNNRQRRFVPLRLDNCMIEDTLKQFAYIDWRHKDQEQYDQLLLACAPRVTSDLFSVRTPLPPLTAQILLEHDTQLQCVSMSADGSVVVCGGDSRDLQVRRSSSDDAADISILTGHEHYITGVAVSEDGDTVVSASYDGRIRVWALATNTASQVIKIMPNGDPITRIAVTSDCQRLIVRTESLYLIDDFAVDYEERDPHAFEGSENGTDEDGCLTVIDLTNGEVVGDFNGKLSASKAVGISPDGTVVAYAGVHGCIYVCDIARGVRYPALHGHYDIVTDLAFIPHSTRLVSSSADRTIRIWDYDKGHCIYVLEGHTGPVIGVQLAQEGKVLASCELNGTIITWSSGTGERLLQVVDNDDKDDDFSDRTAFAISSDGRSGVTTSVDTVVRHFTIPEHEMSSDQSYYTNAKVLLVGDSGVGKSGLAMRLTHDRFEPTISSDAHWATQLKLPYVGDEDASNREIWLWDFAGQADYRLIHQLFMDETSLAVLVFNPQSENPFDGLAQWDRDLARAARRTFSKLLVAGRCDRGGLMVSLEAVERFVGSHGFALYLGTSALTGDGCNALRNEIVARIDWDSIPWIASPRIFKALKDEILRLRDEGVVLLRIAELKQRLEMRLLDEAFFIEELRAVVGLLASPGLVWTLEFGDIVMLQPEWINRYAAAVIRSVRAHVGEIGIIDEGRVLSGDLNYTVDVNRLTGSNEGEARQMDMQRLEPADEAIVLRAMHQMFVDHGLCVREDTESGGRHLIFPSYFKIELPTDPGHPPVLVKYQFEGHAEDIYATLVVQLWQTKAFENGKLWRHAVDFTSASGARLGLKMTRDEENRPAISVYCDFNVQDDTKITFIKYVHEHLLQKARNVIRLRSFICPHCGHAVRDTELARDILYRFGTRAEIRCQQIQCDKKFSLWDAIERRFASSEFQALVKKLERVAKTKIDNESRELILEGHARVIAGEAGQIYRGYTGSDHGIDGEIEFKDGAGQASGKRLYLQLKSGDSYLYERKADGAEVFRIKNARWEKYWRAQAYPVMLVIRTSNGDIRWMNVSEYFEKQATGRSALIREIKFDGQPFTALNVQRLRDKILCEPKE